jgi:hypothetical protein
VLSDVWYIYVVSLIQRVFETSAIKILHEHFVGYLYKMNLINERKLECIKIVKSKLEWWNLFLAKNFISPNPKSNA